MITYDILDVSPSWCTPEGCFDTAYEANSPGCTNQGYSSPGEKLESSLGI